MKIAFGKNGENGAVVLTATICTFALMSFLVVGYLWMMMEQSKAAERSQHWNAALAVAEAGIDEGMAHINWGFGTNVNLATNGWSLNASGGYYGPMVRSVSNDVGSSYSVFISASIPPVVTSTATIVDKMNSIPIKRAVQVTTVPLSAFSYGLTTISNPGVTLKGSQVVITSDVASVYGSINESGGGRIYGNVLTGPGGSFNPAHGTYYSYTNNFYESFPDVQPPYTFGVTPPTTSSVTLTANTKYYYNGNYTGTSSLTIAGTNVVLYVTKNFSVNSITINPGASFSLYVGSGDTSISTTASFGQNSGDKINPSPGTPEQFSYFGLPNNTSIVFQNGLVSVSGAFYAPEADFTQRGNMSFDGALLCSSYTSNGNVAFNYDPKLKKDGPFIGFTAASWKEIPPP